MGNTWLIRTLVLENFFLLHVPPNQWRGSGVLSPGIPGRPPMGLAVRTYRRLFFGKLFWEMYQETCVIVEYCGLCIVD